jgi:hypothetical protein
VTADPGEKGRWPLRIAEFEAFDAEARRIHLQWRTRVVEDGARQRCPARCPDALPLVDTHIKQVTHERRTSTRPQQRQHVAVSNSSDASLA